MEDISSWDINPAFDSVTADAPITTEIVLCSECAHDVEGGDTLQWDAVTIDDSDVQGWSPGAICDACLNVKARYYATALDY